ncbi:EF-hand_domain pair [Hexamita inflata]|uniref:EF-hand domain pair n=1 Tax=Hexamita inflata TaxID=28002 RepID=A0AA86U6T8_9EUKA|nr:EF-hand domain pair [Hexamita inflata]
MLNNVQKFQAIKFYMTQINNQQQLYNQINNIFLLQDDNPVIKLDTKSLQINNTIYKKQQQQEACLSYESDQEYVFIKQYCDNFVLVSIRKPSSDALSIFKDFLQSKHALDVKNLANDELFINKSIFVSPSSFLMINGNKLKYEQLSTPYYKQEFILICYLQKQPDLEFQIQRFCNFDKRVHVVFMFDAWFDSDLLRLSFYSQQLNVVNYCQQLYRAFCFDLIDLRHNNQLLNPRNQQIQLELASQNRVLFNQYAIQHQFQEYTQLTNYFTSNNISFNNQCILLSENYASLFGIRLRFHKNINIEPNNDLVVYFNSPKNKQFASDLVYLKTLFISGFKVIIILKNSWEFNIDLVLRKNKLDGEFGILYDIKQVQDRLAEISSHIDQRPAPAARPTKEYLDSLLIQPNVTDQPLFFFFKGLAHYQAQIKSKEQMQTFVQENNYNNYGEKVAEFLEQQEEALKALFDDETIQELLRLFKINSNGKFITLKKLIKIFGHMYDPFHMTKLVHQLFDEEDLTLDQFLLLMSKLGWKGWRDPALPINQKNNLSKLKSQSLYVQRRVVDDFEPIPDHFKFQAMLKTGVMHKLFRKYTNTKLISAEQFTEFLQERNIQIQLKSTQYTFDEFCNILDINGFKINVFGKQQQRKQFTVEEDASTPTPEITVQLLKLFARHGILSTSALQQLLTHMNCNQKQIKNALFKCTPNKMVGYDTLEQILQELETQAEESHHSNDNNQNKSEPNQTNKQSNKQVHKHQSGAENDSELKNNEHNESNEIVPLLLNTSQPAEVINTVNKLQKQFINNLTKNKEKTKEIDLTQNDLFNEAIKSLQQDTQSQKEPSLSESSKISVPSEKPKPVKKKPHSEQIMTNDDIYRQSLRETLLKTLFDYFKNKQYDILEEFKLKDIAMVEDIPLSILQRNFKLHDLESCGVVSFVQFQRIMIDSGWGAKLQIQVDTAPK